jgi:hypothetical protein
MAITTNDLTAARSDRSGKTPFAVFFTSTDLQGCEVIKAIGTNSGLYLKKLVVWTSATLNWTVGAGKTSTAVTAALVGPVTSMREVTGAGVAHGIPFEYEFVHKDGISVGADLTIDASAAGIVCGIAEGFTVV